MTGKGKLVVQMVHAIEQAGLSPVYLRNHEDLPADVGNDVDLLIQRGKVSEAESIAKHVAKDHGWVHFKSVQFGPLSMFFRNADGSEFLHIDLFTRLEWHFIPLATTEGIIARRRWNGLVFVPDPLDEVFLNVCTRIYYQGAIREKHRAQAAALLKPGDTERFLDIAREHIGPAGANIIAKHVISGNWCQLESLAGKCRKILILHVLSRKTFAFFTSLISFARRGLGRLISPPGPFIVFEGADGVGKSSVIDGCIPFMKALTGQSDVLLFHWKPTSKSVRLAGDPPGPAQDPRGQPIRSRPISLLFLGYHWLGFWTGYLRHVLPAIARNRAVIGDRYAYEFFLDPARLRLALPEWLRRLASITTPKPDLVIGLVARPDTVTSRKQELSEMEIERYQDSLTNLASGRSNFTIIHADGTLMENILNAQASIQTAHFP